MPKVSFISAPGGSDYNIHRSGGPIALITNRCLFSFDRSRKRFRLGYSGFPEFVDNRLLDVLLDRGELSR